MDDTDTGGITRRAFVLGAIGTVAGLGAATLVGRPSPLLGTVAAAASPRVIDRLTVHHTATPPVLGGRVVDAAFIAESHRRRGLGLGTGDARDCAYHFVVLPDGEVQPGRPLAYWGSGTRDGEDNLHSIGVALVGDFSGGPGGPTGAQLDALDALALWAFSAYGLDAEAVLGHREVSPSACPGRRMDMDALRARLAEAAASGVAGVRPPAA